MLFEKTTYTDNFPLNIMIAHIEEYPFHYHHDIEFVYILKGEIWLKNVGQHYLLKEGDLFTNSGHEVHSLTATDKDNIVAIIQVSNRFFTQYFPALLRACFMSYVDDDKAPRIDTLRKMILQILLDYTKRSLNYQSTCINQMIDVIDFLNKHFNLFAFKDTVVTNFKSDNPIIVERISRIINYIYTNHANKITLGDLAENEHLSTYYISHLIHDYMGISFQELLCFARVEMSEILLLETDRKISVIAKDVGFSTTSYYNKYFEKWFGHPAPEYRNLYLSHVLSSQRPACMNNLTENQSISIISRCMSAVSDQEKNPVSINKMHLNIEVDPESAFQIQAHPMIEVVVTQEDYQVMGERLFNFLFELKASRVILSHSPSDNESTSILLENRLRFMGYEVSHVSDNGLQRDPSASQDSIVAAINILQSYFISRDNHLHCRLRDQGDLLKVLKGGQAILTSCMVPKPAFYAYKLIRTIKGNVLSWGKYYSVIKNEDTDSDSFTFVTINYNDDLQYLYQRSSGVHEANDIINSFKNELEIDFSLPVDFGYYAVAKYVLSNSDSIFGYMSQLGFPDSFPLPESWLHLLDTELKSQVTIEKVNSKLNINSSIKGAGVNIIVVKKINQVD